MEKELLKSVPVSTNAGLVACVSVNTLSEEMEPSVRVELPAVPDIAWVRRPPRGHATARPGSAVCAGVRLAGGHPEGGQTRYGLVLLSFRTLPGCHNVCGSLREEGPARGAWAVEPAPVC